MFLAWRIRRILAYRPGLAASGMPREIPRWNAQKSLMLITPASPAMLPKISSVMRERPINKKMLSYAAMNAKYAMPSTATNVPAISNIFGRLARPANNDSMNNSTHIEQGLNPSRSPMTMVKSGRPSLPALRGPNQRVSTLSEGGGGGRALSMQEESDSGRQAS